MTIAILLAAAIAPIDYRVSVETAPAPTVTVAMTFEGDADGETAIDAPRRWAGSDELWRDVAIRKVTGGHAVASKDPAIWRIAHRARATVTVHYTIRDPRPAAPDAATYEKARPVIRRDWLLIHNEGATAMPAGRGAAPARFSIGTMPPGWRLVSDLERPSRPLTADDVASGVLFGGKAIRIVTRPVGTATLRIAMVGAWRFPDDGLADRTARVMTTENAMLGATAVDYLVPVAPLTGSATGAISYGGTGRTAGFALTSTDNVPIGDITRLLAHEYAHRWFGAAFGAVADGAEPYWFTEGVNNWFAGRAMVRAGLWSMADWARWWNSVLLEYGISSARDMTSAEITAKFWTDPDAMQVQYDRGNLTALLLDRSLAAQGGISPILRRMAREPSREDQVVRFTALADDRLPGAVAAARAAATAPLAEDALAACGRTIRVEQPAYDRGFTTDDARRVTAATGPAAAAGVRPGMRYIRRLATEFGNSAAPFRAEFGDGDAVRTLGWLPQGTGKVQFQRLSTDGIATLACRLLVAGSPSAP